MVGSCNEGLLVLLGVAEGDKVEDAEILARKTANLRIFCDNEGKMNLSVLDIKGEILAISQFTLCADVKKGNRPSFIGAMEPEKAKTLYEYYCQKLREAGVKKVDEGIFGADMKVTLVNNGPVTILYDTKIWRKNGD
ncbi:MAG: D-aminoacyl-tRNA deacylase [Acutalibacteraceae bacterium]